jgi:F-type H+-transporting ATPase subunit a
MIIDPLKQFAIREIFRLNLFGFDLIFTNSSLAMLFAVSALLLMFIPVFITSNSSGNSKLYALIEIVYDMINQMVESAAGDKNRKFAPLIFSIFLFVLSCNLLGMLPWSFTATSHIAVTFAMAIGIFIFVTLLGFFKHGANYLSLFLPKGVPVYIAPLLVVIEFFAYIARPISLSIRLAANMIAGHIVLKVLAAFTVMAGVLGVFPFMLLTILTGFEIFVSILQAYIFAILTCVYLNDALNLH